MKLGLIHAPAHEAVPTFGDIAPSSAPGVSWGRSIASYGSYMNITQGTCTIASAANAIAQWNIYSGTLFEYMSDGEVMANFAASGGGPDGTTVDKFMSAWATDGFLCGGKTDKILGYADIDPTSQAQLESALALSGCLFASWNLPIIAQQQFVWGEGGTGDDTPGSWGGHEELINKLDAAGVCGPTWGSLKDATWAFWNRYITRCVVVVTKDWALPAEALDDISQRMQRIRGL